MPTSQQNYEATLNSIANQVALLSQRLQQQQEVVAQQFTDLHQQIEERHDRLQHQLGRISDIILGNGDASKSLVLRVDRLEVDSKRRGRVSWAVVAGVVALLVDLVKRMLH